MHDRRLHPGAFALFLALLLAAGVVQGADRYWIDTGGGDWNDGGNWSTSSGGAGGAGEPGSADRPVFDQSGTYTVTINTAPVATGYLEMWGGTVTFDLTYDYTSLSRLNVNKASATSALKLINGSVEPTSLIRIGTAGSSNGTLTVGTGASLIGDSTLEIGGTSGTGELRIENGGDVDIASSVTLAAGSSNTAKLTITGAGSTFTQTTAGSLFIGKISGGDTTVDISSGGVFTTDIEARVSYDTTINVDGAGSKFINDAETGKAIVLGYYDNAVIDVNITNGGLMEAPDGDYGMIKVGESTGSDVTVTVTGTNSEMQNRRTLSIGNTLGDATALVIVGTGGTVNAWNDAIIYTDGTLRLTGGTFEFNINGGVSSDGDALTLSGGLIEGTGTIAGDADNPSPGGHEITHTTGTVSPGLADAVGKITITGADYVQNGGSLAIEIYDDTSFDEVIASGTDVTLDGDLDVDMLVGGTIGSSDTFDVLIADSITIGVNFTLNDNDSKLDSTTPYQVVTLTSGPYNGKKALRLKGGGGGGGSYPDPHIDDTDIVDKGPIFKSNGLAEVVMFEDVNDDLNLVVFYRRDVAIEKSNFAEILRINITDSADSGILTSPVRGRVHRPVYDSGTHSLYFAGETDLGYLDLSDDSVAKIDEMADDSHQNMVQADDGLIYIGERPTGHLESFDPTDLTAGLTDYGIMGDSAASSVRYVYFLDVDPDNRYVYMAVAYNPWHLAIYDTVNDTQTTHFVNETPAITSVHIRKHKTSGLIYAVKFPTGQAAKYYKLDSGTVTLDTTVTDNDLTGSPNYSPVVHEEQFFESTYGYEVDLTEAIATSKNSETSKIKYRPTAGSWTTVTKTGLTVDGQEVRRMKRFTIDSTDTNYAVVGNYLPVLTYNESLNTSTLVGDFAQISAYDMAHKVVGTDDYIYFSGYSSVFAEYDTTSAWTLTFGVTTGTWHSGTYNPTGFSSFTSAKWLYRTVAGPEGLMYAAGDRARGSDGGAISWYDPSDQSHDENTSDFDDWLCRDVIAVNNSTRLAYAGKSVDGTETAELHVLKYNTSTDEVEIESTYKPFGTDTNYVSAGWIVEVATNEIIGVAPKKTNDNTEWKAYRMDLSDGTVDWTVTLPAERAFGYKVGQDDRRLILGPDGWPWLFVEDNLSATKWSRLYRIDPSNGTFVQVSENLPINTGRPFIFIGNDMYMFGGGNPALEKIAGAHVP